MFEFLPGDILFQDIECGPVCDAISGVTRGYKGADINHCGMVGLQDGSRFVYEAIDPKVARRELGSFLARSLDAHGRPRILVGRLVPTIAPLVPAALAYCSNAVGRPYDFLYGGDEAALYCSELILDAFRSANGGAPVFPQRPMRFRDPGTGEISPFWIAYYARFGMDVPDGEPGSNPADLSCSEHIAIVAQLGDLNGLHA